MQSNKMTEALRLALEHPPRTGMILISLRLRKFPVDVAVNSTRAARIAKLRAYFDQKSRPIADAIHELGGSVVDQAWLNQTILARVPVTALDKLTESDDVERADVPRSLAPD